MSPPNNIRSLNVSLVERIGTYRCFRSCAGTYAHRTLQFSRFSIIFATAILQFWRFSIIFAVGIIQLSVLALKREREADGMIVSAGSNIGKLS